MDFSRIKVSTRLGLGFAVVIVAGIAVAALGGVQLNRVQHSTQLLVQDRLVKIEQVTRIQNNVNHIARAVRNIALLYDEDPREEQMKRLEAAHKDNQELYRQLSASITTPEGQALLQQLDQARTVYNESIEKAANLGMAGQGSMAAHVLMSETPPLQARYFSSLEELTALQRGLMQDTAREVQDLARSTILLMALMAAAAAAAGALIAWQLTRSITRQLGGEPDHATSVAREIAAGRLTAQLQLRAGDTHSLLAAMAGMQASLGQVVSRVRRGSEAVASASTQIAQGNQDLSARTESQASALQQTAASMEQLSSTVRHNADNAQQANQLAQSASGVAQQGGEVVA
ncbi:methyl-accepting chemotaxis protein, partial [Oryzisolibacter propanilivorax]